MSAPYSRAGDRMQPDSAPCFRPCVGPFGSERREEVGNPDLDPRRLKHQDCVIAKDSGRYLGRVGQFVVGYPPRLGLYEEILSHGRKPEVVRELRSRCGDPGVAGAVGEDGVHVVVRDLSASRAAGVVGAVTMLTFQGFTEMATNGPREKTAMVLFLLVSLWALVHRRWATCGVFVALAIAGA